MKQLTLDFIAQGSHDPAKSLPPVGREVMIRTRLGAIFRAHLDDAKCLIVGPVWVVEGLWCYLPVTNAAAWWPLFTEASR